MKRVYECEYCNFMGAKETVEIHEKKCSKNPVNVAAEKEKAWIMKHCKYHRTTYDDGYYEFDSCNKNGHGFGRFADDCIPCQECRQYCK